MQEAGHVRHVLARNGVDLARNLRRLCDNKTQKDGVMAGGGHLALIALLYAGADAVATEHALRALVKLSFQVAASSASLVQAGAADPTVALLRTAPTPSNETVVKNAAILVCNLAKVSAGKEAFQKAGAIAPLVSLLSTTPRIAKSAADALRNLSYPQTANCAEIVEAGAILPLVALLHGKAANSAVAALRNLANDAAGAAAIHSAGGVVPLVALLHAAEAETAWRAADALTIMAMNSEQSRPAILTALAARPPPPPPPNDDRPTLAALLKLLQYTATERLTDAEAGDDDAALQEANAAGALCKFSYVQTPDADSDQTAQHAEIVEAGAIPPLVALLHGEAANSAAGPLLNLARKHVAGAAAVHSAGDIVQLVTLLHTVEAETAEMAADALTTMAINSEQSRPAILTALAARPPPPPPNDDRPRFARLLSLLQPIATDRLTDAEAGDDEAALQEAIDQAAAVRVADAELQRARTKLATVREVAEAARREPPTTRLTPRVLAVTVTAPTPSLGLDELKTPDEFVCPITIEVIQDPVCASDGHTNERSEIEDVLALPEERRNPLMRATLQPFLFPINISRFALRRTSRKKAAQKAIEAKLTSVNHAVQIDDDAWRTLLSGELHVRRSGLFHRQAVSLAAAAHPTGGEQHRLTYTDAATGKTSIGTVLGIDSEAPTKYEFEVVTAEGGSGHNWRVRCVTKKDYADWTSALRTVVPPADLAAGRG